MSRGCPRVSVARRPQGPFGMPECACACAMCACVCLVCPSVRAHARVYVRAGVRAYCMHACVRAYACVRMLRACSVQTHVQARTYTRTHTHVHVCAHAHTYTHSRARARARARARTRTRTRTRTQILTNRSLSTPLQALIPVKIRDQDQVSRMQTSSNKLTVNFL